MEELCFDYGEDDHLIAPMNNDNEYKSLTNVSRQEKQINRRACYCATAKCRGFLPNQ